MYKVSPAALIAYIKNMSMRTRLIWQILHWETNIATKYRTFEIVTKILFINVEYIDACQIF